MTESCEQIDQILRKSLFDSTQPKPLIIYIYEKNSLATDIFNQTMFSSENISSYLTEACCLWQWNLTDENFHELLSLIIENLGEEIGTLFVSRSKETYPLCFCLIFDRGQIKLECLIENWMSENEILTCLIQTIDAFNNRLEVPDLTGLNLTNISKENWSIPSSQLILIENNSDEYHRVVNDFYSKSSLIISLHRIENLTWLLQYFSQKESIDKRLGYNETEKLLFHGSSYQSAEQILRHGFDHQRIGTHGSSYGHGFYFSSKQSTSDRYARPDPLTGEKRILMCRVLIGRTCLGNSSTTTCPTNFDSTTDQSHIYVIYSNRHVLPEYLITYK